MRSRVPGKAFWGIHLAALGGVLLTGWSWPGVGLAIGLYFARMAFVCLAYHRYFAHRTFKTSRAFQAVLAFLAQTSAQKGVLWWAANHRLHHKYSDTALDPHSARERGVWWAHVGWILGPEYDATRWEEIGDFARHRELVWLNRYHLLPAAVFAAACLVLGGVYGFVWGFLVSTVLLWHGTFTINSLAHLVGRRRYDTGDGSRNNWALALITLGEGWHNNHHAYQSCARQGFFWWEYDPAYYLLRLLALIGLVWDVREPPKRVLARRRRRRPAWVRAAPSSGGADPPAEDDVVVTP